MKISDCGEEEERVTARVSGAHNVQGQETSIKDHSIFVTDGTTNSLKRNCIGPFGPTAHVFQEVNP